MLTSCFCLGVVVGACAGCATGIADKKIEQIKDFNRIYINAEINRNCADVLNDIFSMFLNGDEDDLEIVNALIIDIDFRERALKHAIKLVVFLLAKKYIKNIQIREHIVGLNV